MAPIHLNPNMDNQFYIEAQEPSTLLGQTGRGMQPVIAHTVAAGLNPYKQDLLPGHVAREVTKTYDEDWLGTDPSYYKGYVPRLSPLAEQGIECKDRGACKQTSLDCVAGKCVPQFCGPQTPCADPVVDICAAAGPNGQSVCVPKQYEVALPPLLAGTLSVQAHPMPANPAERAAWQESQPFYRFMMRGQDRFGIYCAPCHGENGGGEGDASKGSGIITVRKPSWNIANYHTDDRRAFPLGRIFDTISAGKGTMPGFASQIPVRDRWAIALYVRALQRSHYLETGKVSQIQP